MEMFEIIKVLVEYLSKLINPTELSKLKRQKDMRELGCQLLILYVRLNEIIVTGEEIIRGLERYVERTEADLAQGETSEWLLKWGSNFILPNLLKQHSNIDRLNQALTDFHEELAIIDADAYLKLHYLLVAKRSAIDQLLEIVADGNMPLGGPTEEEIKEYLEDPSLGRAFRPTRYERSEFADRIGWELRRDAIPISKPWNNDVYRQVKEDLDSRKPREQLKYIYAVATQLRESLEKYFSITDILLEVGDRRFG
jgi:hypothetical protein